MKSCQEYEVLISAFLDGELSGEERETVAEHLASCPACQQYFNDLVAIHDAFGQVEEAPVPEGFASAVMDRVWETPQEPSGKVIRFPHWRRWTALAACCAIAALGIWRFQFHDNGGWDASQVIMARSGPPVEEGLAIASDMDAPAEDWEDAGEDAPVPQTDAVELPGDGAAAQKAAPEDTEAAPAEACLDQELESAFMRDSAPTGGLADGTNAAPQAPPSTLEDLEGPLSGILTAGGDEVRIWVEDTLGLEWESGRTYLLTEEEFSQLLDLLAESEADFQHEPGEGCWLVAAG